MFLLCNVDVSVKFYFWRNLDQHWGWRGFFNKQCLWGSSLLIFYSHCKRDISSVHKAPRSDWIWRNKIDLVANFWEGYYHFCFQSKLAMQRNAGFILVCMTTILPIATLSTYFYMTTPPVQILHQILRICLNFYMGLRVGVKYIFITFCLQLLICKMFNHLQGVKKLTQSQL